MASPTWRPALGQNIALGTLYDARSDTFLSRSIARDAASDKGVSVSQKPNVEIKTALGHNYQQKFDLLGSSPDFIANYFAGYVKARGLASYLHSPRVPGGRAAAALLYKLSVCTQRLNIHDMAEEALDLEALRGIDATHVVMAVEWGVQSVVELRPRVVGDTEGSAADAVLAAAEGLKSSLGPTPATTRHTDGTHLLSSEIPLDIEIFSDTMEGPVLLQALSEAGEFLSMFPTQVQQLDNGYGIPIGYQLMPLAVLTYINTIFADIPAPEVISIRVDYAKGLVSMFDAFQAACQSLADYHAYIANYPSFVPKQHLNLVWESLNQATTRSSSFEHQLSSHLRDVRSGGRPASDLDQQLQDFICADSNPEKLMAQWAGIREKAVFAAAIVSRGGIYVGYNGMNLRSVLRQKHDRDVYVMSYSTEVMADQNAWNANKALLFELLETTKGNSAIVIVDSDGSGDGQGPQEEVHTALYQNEALVTDDILEQREFMADQCLVRYDPGTLEFGEKLRKPIKRRPVKIPCPGRRCERKVQSWICSECTTAVEFGYTDIFIYCECGRSKYANYEFKCNSPGRRHEYIRYSNRDLLTYLQKLEPPDCLNILILGETGVGKSTFINAFVNYLKNDSLDEAKRAELSLVIPCAFSTQVMDRTSGKIEEHHVKLGHDRGRSDEKDGSKGSSATQQTMVYTMPFGGRTVRLFDTPGIGDTRGLQYDKQNIADILNTINNYDELHGILILVKSNNARLTIMFEFCVKELLTHLHRSAVENMAFGFTNTRISNYMPGDTFGPLKAILGSQKDVNIALTAHTVYCFDSESFRYLAAIKNNVPMSNEDDFRRSWQKSRDETLRLITYFDKLTPHPVASTISLNGTRRLIAELTKPMAEISAIIRINIANLKDRRNEIQNERLSGEKLRQRLHIEKVLLKKVDLDQPRTVCSDKACCEFRDDGTGTGTVRTIYKTHCHSGCSQEVEIEKIAAAAIKNCCVFRDGAFCKRCTHHWQQHLHVLYELEEYKAIVKDEGIETQIRKHATDLTLKQTATEELSRRIEEYGGEHEQICKAAAHFGLFLQRNSITPINDKTLEYLDHLIRDEDAKVQHGGRDTKLRGLREDRQKHVELVTVLEHEMRRGALNSAAALDKEGVDRTVRGLYNLKHFGENLRDVKDGINASHQATYREVYFSVSRRKRSPMDKTNYQPPVMTQNRRRTKWQSGGSSLMAKLNPFR